jgi:anti-sigma B factor antagonist
MNNDIVPGFDDEKNDSIKLKLQKIEDMEGGLIVYASGYIDTYNVSFFRKPVERAVESGYVRIVFELSRINYISSTGFGAFPHFLKLVKPQNGDMVLNQVQPKVYEVFALLGFSQYFIFMENLDASIGYLAGHLESPLFPKVFTCPICSKRLRASKAGRFRCAECKSILVIDKATSVMLGCEGGKS